MVDDTVNPKQNSVLGRLCLPFCCRDEQIENPRKALIHPGQVFPKSPDGTMADIIRHSSSSTNCVSHLVEKVQLAVPQQL